MSFSTGHAQASPASRRAERLRSRRVDASAPSAYNALKRPSMDQSSPTKPKPAKPASERGEVLVAIMNHPRDLMIAREKLWYRVPVASAPKRWPPQWLAFYLPKVFRDEAFSVRYYGKVIAIRRVPRRVLFPNEERNPNSDREYYQIFLESLQERTPPIVSYRLWRIVFIATTLDKFYKAVEINDLFDDSPLEDALWLEMQKLQLRAERQFEVTHATKRYFLDFALFCEKGKLDVETDGDTWHADPLRIPEDNRRDNVLGGLGYHMHRFNTMQVRKQMADYCVPQILETVNRLGGVLDPHGAPRTYYTTADGTVQQMGHFES
jgi:very-short-patch-repair endonuclease